MADLSIRSIWLSLAAFYWSLFLPGYFFFLEGLVKKDGPYKEQMGNGPYKGRMGITDRPGNYHVFSLQVIFCLLT